MPKAWWRSSSLLLAVICVLGAMILIVGSSLVSHIRSNLGWRQFAEAVAWNSRDNTSASHFAHAVAADSANQRAYLGGGMAFARAADEAQALSRWQEGAIAPGLLNRLGQKASGSGLLDLAFVYFRSADELSQSETAEGSFRAGRICQANYADLTVLSPTDQQYCAAYFANAAHNLILDGQFNGGLDWAWGGLFSFVKPDQAAVGRDLTAGKPAPSLQLTGLTSARHPGVYQRIALAPGTRVRFSGYFRTESGGDLGARLLYIGWKRNGESQGNHSYLSDSDMDWTYLEREFTLPEESEPWAQFYPAVVSGQGKVWSDKIVVEVLDE